MADGEWNLKPGDTLSRDERTRRFGGSKFSGIAPSAQTPNVFIYSDPKAGKEFGYDDHWDPGGQTFFYSGEGAIGDQTFDSPGNGAIRGHKADGKAVRLFEADGTQPGSSEVIQRYSGRLEIDDVEPYTIRRGPDATGAECDVIVFRLNRIPEKGRVQVARVEAFERSVNNLADNSDPEGFIAELRDIRVDVHQGRPVPYKYVVLLWAISKALSEGQRRFRYQDVSKELAAVLKPFQMSASRPDPRNPWFALKETPLWWDLTLPDNAGLTYKQTRELNLDGGLNTEVFNLLRDDPDFASRAVRSITAIIGDSPTTRALISELQLDTVAAGGSEKSSVRRIPVENHLTEDFAAEYKALGRKDRTRKEAKLQRQYEDYLQNTLHHKISRHEIRIDAQALYTDLYDETTDDLIEVKSSIERSTMRLALGQILDYAYMLNPNLRTVLVPARPSQGIIDLYHRHGVRVVWRDDDVYVSSMTS